MNGWIDVAGWTLLHFVWQGALAAAVAAVGLGLLRSARARYTFACCALAVMLAAPAITAWSIARPSAPSAAHLHATNAGAPAADAAALPPARPATSPETPSDPAPARVASSIDSTSLMPIVVTLWLAGVALFLARLAGGCWRVRRLHRVAVNEPVSRWQAAADGIARRLRLAGPVFIVDSMRVDTPTVIGWLRPVILLPVAAMTNLAPAQVEAILAHELAHIRRHDFLVNLLQSLAETFLFYHPAVWWLSSRIRTEREHCCDDVAVDVCGDPVTYAAALTELAAWSLARPPLALAATSGSLLVRVRRLLHVTADGRTTRSSSGILIGGLALVLIVIIGSVRAISVAQVPDADRATDDRRFGPPDINTYLGFELFPGPKRWPTDDPRYGRAWDVTINYSSGEMRLLGFTARSIIRHAYGLVGTPIVNAPEWLDRQSFDLSVASDLAIVNGISDPEALQAALRDLVEQQLGLVTHREQREFPVYALVRSNADGALGPGIAISTADCWDTRPRAFSQRPCGIDNNLTGIIAEKVTIAEFVADIRGTPLSPDLPVVDRTGLSAKYDFTVRFGFLPLAAIGAGHPVVGAALSPFGFRSLHTALPEQLGLELEKSTAPFDVLVIDRIEKPAS